MKYNSVMPPPLLVVGSRFQLRRHHLYLALMVATGLHLVGFAGWDWLYQPEPVKQIKVLTLKLSGGGEIFSENRPAVQPAPVAPVDQVQAVPPESIAPEPQTTPMAALDPVAEGLPSALPNETAAPVEEEVNLWEETEAPGSPAAPEDSRLLFPPDPSEMAKPEVKPKVARLPRPQAAAVAGEEEDAIVPMVKNPGTGTGRMTEQQFAGRGEGGIAPWEARRYVRDTSGTGGAGAGSATQVRDAQVIAKYEQELSRWILKHKVYPTYARNQNMAGYVVVRIQIDRQGRLLDYWLELKSQHGILDHAARDMIKRASPMPAIPPDYPAGDKFEFLIPVSFGIQNPPTDTPKRS